MAAREGELTTAGAVPPAATPTAMARALGDGWEAPAPAPAARDDANPGAPLTREAVWAALHEVPDPEVPVISVVDLGIVRDVALDGDGAVTVTITPTYSGCPAMREIEADVVAALAARGWSARVRTVHSPAWTTDWMSDDARERLRAYGIAPPGRGQGGAQPLVPLLRRGAAPAPVPCPFCGSTRTRLTSAFGTTACKALHVCEGCRQPFEEFKPI